jgi:hypothetical protein
MDDSSCRGYCFENAELKKMTFNTDQCLSLRTVTRTQKFLL